MSLPYKGCFFKKKKLLLGCVIETFKSCFALFCKTQKRFALSVCLCDLLGVVTYSQQKPSLLLFLPLSSS